MSAPQPLLDTANLLGIAAASPNTAAQLKKFLPQSAYGQGQVVASPFQMARVAATVANAGQMPEGRWIVDETNTAHQRAAIGARAPIRRKRWRSSCAKSSTSGTGRRAAGAAVPMAGKTGTAELQDADSHAWFIGFAPYGAAPHKIALLRAGGKWGLRRNGRRARRRRDRQRGG